MRGHDFVHSTRGALHCPVTWTPKSSCRPQAREQGRVTESQLCSNVRFARSPSERHYKKRPCQRLNTLRKPNQHISKHPNVAKMPRTNQTKYETPNIFGGQLGWVVHSCYTLIGGTERNGEYEAAVSANSNIASLLFIWMGPWSVPRQRFIYSHLFILLHRVIPRYRYCALLFLEAQISKVVVWISVKSPLRQNMARLASKMKSK